MSTTFFGFSLLFNETKSDLLKCPHYILKLLLSKVCSELTLVFP